MVPVAALLWSRESLHMFFLSKLEWKYASVICVTYSYYYTRRWHYMAVSIQCAYRIMVICVYVICNLSKVPPGFAPGLNIQQPAGCKLPYFPPMKYR